MDYDQIEQLRTHHPAWRLLKADNAALILAFLGQVFVQENVRSIERSALEARLDDLLFALREQLGDNAFPKSSRAYLDDWAAPGNAWLRKYYPAGSESVHFDASADLEKAVAWVHNLPARSFVGTESRLNTVFELLRQMVHGAETDPQTRLAELKARRAEIDVEIAQVEAGDLPMMEPAGLRDRYQQLSTTARELLSDFRQVETNFRQLDRQLREQIATWSGTKAGLLDEVLGSRTSITESDQGRSFHAFYDFLLSPARQEQFVQMLARVQEMAEIGEHDPRLRHIHHDWLAAGERTQSTVRQLSEQLRRFLDDRVWLENRRVVDLLHGIESVALQLREHAPITFESEIDGSAPQIALPMERPLYKPAARSAIVSDQVHEADDEVDASVLYDQVRVDTQELASGVRQMMQGRERVPLNEVLLARPLEQGLAELVGYLSLNDPGFDVRFDETRKEHVRWEDDGVTRQATLPSVTYVRAVGESSEEEK
ncbi:DUF3375 domain-containing protein [Kineosporia babensis]|uniref:DUF3375 domain-containing protein n=1 Tax=Kineosporia babensis TaxID=499548 RepID=A0A9X1T063_9ACTN|nr:DUF3375 domain-containing protein [Kineosporia babensis]MCD5312403.1 DUF3375 domain-containing protein [Kineosporia babensis]